MRAEEIGVSASDSQSQEGKFQQLEKALHEWLKLTRLKKNSRRWELLKDKSPIFCRKMNINEETFKA